MQYINHKIPTKISQIITKFQPNSAEKSQNSNHKQFVKKSQLWRNYIVKSAKTHQILATLAELYVKIRQTPPKISNFGGILNITTLFDTENIIYL